MLYEPYPPLTEAASHVHAENLIVVLEHAVHAEKLSRWIHDAAEQKAIQCAVPTAVGNGAVMWMM